MIIRRAPWIVRLVLAAAGLAAVPAAAQDAPGVPLEYRVKAAYLFNFTKFVEWPDAALPPEAPITICVAGTSPFGQALEETIHNETVNGRKLAARGAQPADGCNVLFVPHGADAAAALRRFSSMPVLTVGESADFLRQGGMVNFIIDNGRVRFEINHEAAERAQVRISSRLLRLARGVDLPREVR